MRVPRRAGVVGLDRLARDTANVQIPAATRLLAQDDGKHVVGAVGEPAFQNGWGPFPGAQLTFRLDNAGMLHLQGTVEHANPAISTHTLVTLPDGYRPAGPIVVAVMVGLGHPVSNAVEILADGQVRVTVTGDAASNRIYFANRIRLD